MKILSALTLLLMSHGLFSQNDELTQLKQLWLSYQDNQELTIIDEALTLIEEIEEQGLVMNTKELLQKALIYREAFKHNRSEDPTALAEKVIQAFATVLEADEKMIFRHQILAELYNSKNEMIISGNEAYAKNELKLAFEMASKALAANNLEINYPRFTARDTSLIFSRAVFANLAGEEEIALTEFEKLVEWQYNRPDLYDYLLVLYQKDGNQTKVEEIKKLKSIRFPQK